MRFLATLLLNGIAIIVAAWLVPGLDLADNGAALMAGVILGLVNAVVRPVLFVLTLPITLVTLGLFLFVLNAACLALTALVIPGFTIDGFIPAVAGALVVSVVSWMLNGMFMPKRDRR
ncbi:MAG TPA: phage holin family protein [Vicinamibacterales bacterium]|nr:phage holin family protein [Vicinamibacterales bacterium]